MGGGFGWFKEGSFNVPTYSNQQILQEAQSNYSNDAGLRDAYKNELLKQLRDKSYTTPYAVYQSVLGARAQSQHDQQLAEQQAAEQAAQGDQGGYYQG